MKRLIHTYDLYNSFSLLEIFEEQRNYKFEEFDSSITSPCIYIYLRMDKMEHSCIHTHLYDSFS